MAISTYARLYTSFLLIGLLTACGTVERGPEKILSDAPPAYDYPIRNAYAATVIGMPPEQKIDLSDIPKPKERTIDVIPGRREQIPEGFWYERGLRYAQLLQSRPAPIIYVIPGTGGDHRAEKMQALAKMFYAAGYHVVLLPSPTHQNFIINASGDFLGGHPVESAEDLYRVINLIDKKIGEDVGITDHFLTGYSLGAMDAAFTAKLDDERHQLNFKRVLLINPPYDLYNSIRIIDRMLYTGMPDGIDGADKFLERLIGRLSSMSQSGDALDFTNERLLLDAYEKYKPDDSRLATTIGLSFRVSAASMIFAGDVMSHRGFIFPKDKEFTTDTNLDTVMAVALRVSFTQYAEEVFAEQMRKKPGETRESLAAQASLAYLGDYLRGNPKFGLITNADDVILAPGEINKLSAMFGNNALIFSNGGHLGNMTHPAVAYAIVHFIQYGGRP